MMRPLFYGLIKHDFFLLPSQQGLDSWELAACTCVVTGPFLVSVFFPFSSGMARLCYTRRKIQKTN